MAALVTLAACGGGSPTGPSGGGGSGSTPVVRSTGSVGPLGATITITSAGVSPSAVTISVGQSVTFVNSDSRTHDMESDPHPSHGNCPSIANVGIISPGQSKTSFGFANAGTCGYHDHNDFGNASLQGRIVIQ